MSLSLDITTNYTEDIDLKITLFDGSIKAYLDGESFEEALNSEKPIEIGHLRAYRINLAYDSLDLVTTADYLGGDLFRFTEFFHLSVLDDLDYLPAFYLFYLSSISIEPRYRGSDYGLQALAIFLELFAQGQLVGCHPVPMKDLEDKHSEEKGKLLMRKYWSKLGLKNYESNENILWTDDWELPDWLRTKVFKD
ncbi:hypothetical protein QUA70_19670 [Microcoleus sp. LAD1_D5]|uniref:hypothetical protein n=1 Tax=Microcoleus sp. LAD1_D5 TaxID=2818813 RepID=UPI002FD2A094